MLGLDRLLRPASSSPVSRRVQALWVAEKGPGCWWCLAGVGSFAGVGWEHAASRDAATGGSGAAADTLKPDTS